MASTEPWVVTAEEEESKQVPRTETQEQQAHTSTAKPIEMSDMSKTSQIGISQSSQTSPGISATPGNPPQNDHSTNPPPVPPIPESSTAPPLTRELTRPAIGPAIDDPPPLPKEPEIEGPVLYITLLLITGARHPFKLDQKYLKKRNVEVEGNNPVNMSLYKLKELILRDWREEWEAKPSSPDSIRLISMGKLLTDKSKLSDFGFKDGASPTIVHMTIKPQEIVDEEEANKNTRERDGGERSPRCRCTIM